MLEGTQSGNLSKRNVVRRNSRMQYCKDYRKQRQDEMNEAEKENKCLIRNEQDRKHVARRRTQRILEEI